MRYWLVVSEENTALCGADDHLSALYKFWEHFEEDSTPLQQFEEIWKDDLELFSCEIVK